MRMMVSQLKFQSLKSQVEKPKFKRKLLRTPLLPTTPELSLLKPRPTRNMSLKPSKTPLKSSLKTLKRLRKNLRNTTKN